MTAARGPGGGSGSGAGWTGGAGPDDALVRICDLAGRPRGTGFLADADGTMLTSHEAVDGLARLVLHAPGGQVCLVEAGAVTVLPESGLALVATEGLGVRPLPVAPGGPAHPERRMRLRAPHPCGGTVLGTATVTYTATDRFHLLEDVYELALDGADPAGVPPQASGSPVVDAATGAVLGVVATALQSGRRAAGFAVPLRAAGAPRPLAELLARNAATVPGYGPHLNLAGALRLTATSAGGASGVGVWREPVARPDVAAALRDFLARREQAAPLVLGLVGEPGSGRSTELLQLAARRARGPRPAPTLWLRGAELRPADGGIRDAVERSLRTAARIVGPAADPLHASPDAVAELAHAAGRPLLVLLDAPEEMPPVLAQALPDWTAGTARWLRAGHVRLVVACRPEFWEQAGGMLPRDLLYGVGAGALGVEPPGAGPARSGRQSGPSGAYGPPGSSVLPGPLGPSGPSGSSRSSGAFGGAGSGAAADRLGVPVRPGPSEPPGPFGSSGGAGLGADGDAFGVSVQPRSSRLPGPSEPLGPSGSYESFGSSGGAGSGAAAVEPGASVWSGAAGPSGPPGLPGPVRGSGGFGADAWGLPPCVRLGDLDAEQAARARERYGVPPGALGGGDEAHPLALRLLSEVRAAVPDGGDGTPTRAEVFGAHLDLVCLRIAVRLAAAAEPPVRGTGVRRLAARVAGQVHEAARRCLGPGQGELDREAFEELFPWRTGWASAALTEGLLVPAGAGYRFAHEEAADWLQAMHLDLGAALHALVHRWFAAPATGSAEAPVRLPSVPGARAGQPPPVPPAPPVGPPAGPRSLPVPRHRAGPVVQALMMAPPEVRAGHLADLVRALDHQAPPPTRCAPPEAAPGPPPPVDLDADTVPNPRPRRAARPEAVPTALRPGRPHRAPLALGPGRDRLRHAETRHGEEGFPPGRSDSAAAVRNAGGIRGAAVRRGEAVWWAAHLLREALLRAPDAGRYRDVLRALAARIAVRAVERGGFTPEAMGGLGEFGPRFWRALRLTAAERLELLRLLLPADGPPGSTDRGERFLTAVADVLCAAPAEALPALCGWFGDDRPLQAPPGTDEPRLTVASAAQALLHTHRGLAVDDLTEALVAAAHPAADELLAALAEDEPSAVCRAVDRWAHDPRPGRHAAAASYGPRAAPFVRSAADRELLRYAALAVLARPGDRPLHGAVLGMLVRDPVTRTRYLPAALEHFAAADPGLPAGALAEAIATDPDPVLAAFRARLRSAGTEDGDLLAELAAVTDPAPARRTADLVRDHLRHRPESAPGVARFLDLLLEQGPGVRDVVLPPATALLRDHPPGVRRALVPVLVAPGTRRSRPLRQELLDAALASERDPDVLDALLTAAADGSAHNPPDLTRDLVHRLGLLLCRTPEGAARFDRRIVELAAAPAFGTLLRGWLTDGGSWDAVVGPSARRRLDAGPLHGPSATAR